MYVCVCVCVCTVYCVQYVLLVVCLLFTFFWWGGEKRYCAVGSDQQAAKAGVVRLADGDAMIQVNYVKVLKGPDCTSTPDT